MENTVDNVKSQMRKGVLEYCILSILNKKDAYASSIIDELKGANMIVVEGTEAGGSPRRKTGGGSKPVRPDTSYSKRQGYGKAH